MINYSTEKLKSSLADITKPEQPKVKYKETDPEQRIKTQKAEFLTLLTTQLKNQDPFAPMDTNTMAQQMFAISGVEQQLETNKILGVIRDLINSNYTSNAITYMGKNGFFEGNTFHLQDPTKKFPINYELDGEVENLTMRIFDNKGKEVHKENIIPSQGKNTFVWEPKPEMLPGIYKYQVELNHKDDKKPAKVKTYGYGHIDGVTLDNGKNIFNVNGEDIPANRFKQIIDGI